MKADKTTPTDPFEGVDLTRPPRVPKAGDGILAPVAIVFPYTEAMEQHSMAKQVFQTLPSLQGFIERWTEYRCGVL